MFAKISIYCTDICILEHPKNAWGKLINQICSKTARSYDLKKKPNFKKSTISRAEVQCLGLFMQFCKFCKLSNCFKKCPTKSSRKFAAVKKSWSNVHKRKDNRSKHIQFCLYCNMCVYLLIQSVYFHVSKTPASCVVFIL